MHDCIVVGSGCTGAMAAQTLVEAGVSVAMLDVGNADTDYAHLIPNLDFLGIRRTDPDQHRYFLGDDFEAIPSDRIGTGAQLTPPRKFITRGVAEYLPLRSSTFHPLESLAYGGLGSVWGLGCCMFSNHELSHVGLDPAAMQQAYDVVSGRIGISGTADDASPYTVHDLPHLQEPVALDENCGALYASYRNRRSRLHRRGFFMGRPALALITEAGGERNAYAYRDMDFYTDHDRSAYRPWLTVEELKRRSNFQYISQRLVVRFKQIESGVAIICIDTRDNSETCYHARRVVLAAGALGTARIVLRSIGDGSAALPLLCNPYCYVPCIQPRVLGREVSAQKTGFAQLTLFHDSDRSNSDVAMASIYSYRSLMLFRIIREAPLNYVDGRILMRYLLPGITIMGIHQPVGAETAGSLRLERADTCTGDRLHAHFTISESDERRTRSREDQFIRAMRKLGCYAIRRIRPGHGSSVHYAGTLPFNDDDTPFSIGSDGRLNGTRDVFVADGSGFRYLPAKGLTFSLMANAHLVAKRALKE